MTTTVFPPVPADTNRAAAAATSTATSTATSSTPTTSLDAPVPAAEALRPFAPSVACVRSVVKRYGHGDTAVTALDDVTVWFPRGSFTSIMGPSGSGKSTLMHVAAGLDDVCSGEVFVDGDELGAMSDAERTRLRRDRLGFVFQGFNLIPTLTAIENITLPIRLAGRSVDDTWIASLVAMVGLADRVHHRPSELSGGQQQRVAVARALATRPALVFADEPTGNLDARSGAEILDFLRRAVREMDQTVVMVTHDPVAASYSDQVLFLADGRIVDQVDAPTPERVLDRMKQFGA